MPIREPSSRYSPVDMREDDRMTATTTTSSRNSEPGNQDGYMKKMKVFLTTASSTKTSKTKPSRNYNCKYQIHYLLFRIKITLK